MKTLGDPEDCERPEVGTEEAMRDPEVGTEGSPERALCNF